jgi:hypothetical protein
MRSSRWAVAITVAFVGAGFAACYRPDPKAGSFSCSVDLGSVCPNGLRCSPEGLCVDPSSLDMGRASLDLSGDQGLPLQPRSCEQLVQQGAFANLTALTNVNSAVDEAHIALDPSGKHLLFQRGNQVFTAAIDGNNPKNVAAPQSVTLTGGPSAVHGASFTSDGVLWFAGTSGSSTSLYSATAASDTDFTVGAAHAPVAASCPFSDPVFLLGDATKDLFAAFALGGCSGSSYVVQGRADRNIQAFYSGLVDSGWAAPSLTPSGLGLVVSSTVGSPRLYFSSRSATNYQFVSASRIDMTALGGNGQEDRQLVVSADCRTLYLSSVRSGGMGGADLYAADILPE